MSSIEEILQMLDIMHSAGRIEYNDYCDLHDAISEIQESERKTGKWVLFDSQRQEDISNGNYMYTCTNCLHSDVHSKSVVVPYCWYCGAKMEG